TLMVLTGIAIGGVFQLKQLSVSEALQQKIFIRAAFEFAYRIPNMRQDILEDKHSPELVNRFFDSITIQKGLSKILMDFSGALLMVALGLIIICMYHPFFIFFSIFVLTYLAIIFFITTRQGLKTSLKESKYKYEVAYWLEEVARTHDVFRYSGKSELHLEKTDELVSGYISARKLHFKVLKGKYLNMVIFKILVAAGLLAIGGWLVLDQKMNIGQFVASEIIIILLLNSIEKVILNMEVIYDVLTGLDKIGQITDLPLEEATGLKLDDKLNNSSMDISLLSASFRYPLEKTNALSDLTINIPFGSKINFMGGSGSGRSTLLNVFSASFPLTEGSMTVNGIPVNNLDIPELRKKIAVVRSVDQIFKGTLIENISLGREGQNLEKISSICDNLGLSNFIFQSKDGFNTELLPGGKGIPYSAAYKILIARALYLEPSLVLIDEGFDSLNHKDQEAVANEIFSEKYNFTVLSFSNRKAMAEKCTNTIFLERGRIAEILTFKDVEQKGLINKFI
ncbi:MAG: ATP-binding cassette domain-containing protein, partial [Bacteroidota bacterium]